MPSRDIASGEERCNEVVKSSFVPPPDISLHLSLPLLFPTASARSPACVASYLPASQPVCPLPLPPQCSSAFVSSSLVLRKLRFCFMDKITSKLHGRFFQISLPKLLPAPRPLPPLPPRSGSCMSDSLCPPFPSLRKPMLPSLCSVR